MLGRRPLASAPLTANRATKPATTPPDTVIHGLIESSGTRGGYTVPPQMAGVGGAWQQDGPTDSGSILARLQDERRALYRRQRKRREAYALALCLSWEDDRV